MNILSYFPEEESYMGQWQKYHIFDELKSHGHSIYLFNPLLYNTIEQANIELVKYIKSCNCTFDLFMNSLGSDQLYPDTIAEIKKIGIQTLLICFDNLHAPYMHKTIAPYFDLVWLTSKETKRMFERWGCNIVFMPYAANPNIFIPKPDTEIPCVGFIGIPYGSRIDKINILLKHHIKCQIYSPSILEGQVSNLERPSYFDLLNKGFNLIRFKIGRKVIFGALLKKCFRSNTNSLIDSPDLDKKSSVPFEEMNYLYSNFALSLGITELRNTYTLNKPVHKLHLRTFEIPMCGGLQVASYTKELSEYFEEDKEIILYKSDEEMISKIKFYLRTENKSLRNTMKNRARVRAENEHSWNNRFENIFRILSLPHSNMKLESNWDA